MLEQVKNLVLKEIKMEFRQKYAFGGILLYVLCTVFVSYLSFKRIIDVSTWNALFWVIVLFTSINAITKSFINESRGRQLYLYTLVSPQPLVLSKIIYNSFLTMLLSSLCLLLYVLFMGNMVADITMYMFVLFLGCSGVSSTLTLISAIASKTSNAFSVTAILGFPVLVPLLITIIKASKNAIDGLNWSVNYSYLFILLLLNIIVILLSYILFPYLWRE